MIIINSFPKSGTNLLKQALSPFGPFRGHVGMYEGRTGKMFPHQALVETLGRMARMDGYMTAHLHWRPEFADIFEESGAKVIFLYRDPRDVVVSHAHYVLATESHSLHEYYKGLGDLQACFRTSMEGLPGEKRFDFPDIFSRFLPYIGWYDNAFLISFEDIVPEPNETFELLIQMIWGLDLLDEVKKNIKPEESPTFRKGEVGSWKEEMSKENINYFRIHFSWMLELLGYGWEAE